MGFYCFLKLYYIYMASTVPSAVKLLHAPCSQIHHGLILAIVICIYIHICTYVNMYVHTGAHVHEQMYIQPIKSI